MLGLLFATLIVLIGFQGNAETFVINGKEKQNKLQAIVALAQNPKTKVERCKFTEGQDSNEGKIVCKTVELGPRGTIRLQK